MNDIKDKSAQENIQNLLQNDGFSTWMGVEIVEVKSGYAKIKMSIRDDMLNGLGVAHGGIIYAFADTALAYAGNSRGTPAFAIDNNINYIKKVNVGDVLFAETTEEQNGRTMGVYKVGVTNQKGEIVAVFRGTVFKSN